MKLWSTDLASGDRVQFKGGQRTEAVPGSPNKHDRCKAGFFSRETKRNLNCSKAASSALIQQKKTVKNENCEANFERFESWLH